MQSCQQCNSVTFRLGDKQTIDCAGCGARFTLHGAPTLWCLSSTLANALRDLASLKHGKETGSSRTGA